MNNVTRDMEAAQIRGHDIGQVSDRATSEGITREQGETKVVAAVPTGSAIPPDDWECPECGTDSQACAVIKPLEEMQMDERLTLEAYGKSEDQFLIEGGEIVLCGCCHGSHWRAPNIAGLTAAPNHSQPQP